MPTRGRRSDPPASSSSTRVARSSLRRAASTHPALPAPTMTKSNAAIPPSRGSPSQQAPAFLFQARVHEADGAPGRVVEVVPGVAPGAGREVDLVRHPQGAQLLVQPVVAAEPGV